ncbi:MAG: hypothetical protein ACLS4Z_04665 [Christensenellaceae bacterium]
MLTPKKQYTIGHEVGGVCPLRSKGVEIYLDISLKRFETVFPACGNCNTAEFTIPELERYSHFLSWMTSARAGRKAKEARLREVLLNLIKPRENRTERRLSCIRRTGNGNPA